MSGTRATSQKEEEDSDHGVPVKVENPMMASTGTDGKKSGAGEPKEEESGGINRGFVTLTTGESKLLARMQSNPSPSPPSRTRGKRKGSS